MGNQADKPQEAAGAGAAGGPAAGQDAGGPLEVTPHGLYESYSLEAAVLADAIRAGRLADCKKGRPTDSGGGEECPICFLHYVQGLNRAQCCKNGLCTECFLQMHAEALPEGVVGGQCPFCSAQPLRVAYEGAVPEEVLLQVSLEQQRIEARQREVAAEQKRRAEEDRRHALQQILCLSGDASGRPGGALAFPGDDAAGGDGGRVGSNTPSPAELRTCITAWRDHYQRAAPASGAGLRGTAPAHTPTYTSAHEAFEALLAVGGAAAPVAAS